MVSIISIVITATDNDGSSSSNNFTINVGTTPTFSGIIGDQNETQNEFYRLYISGYFTQTEGDSIVYSNSGNLPTGITLNSSTGLLSGTPTVLGIYSNITVIATDIRGSVSSNSFTFTVNENLSIITYGYRDFTLRKSFYTKGNIKTIGNTILVPPTTQSSSICSSYTNGAYSTNVSNGNNYHYLCGYQVDAGTTSSTTSELDLPEGAQIQCAGLYWQSVVKQSDYDFSNQMTIEMRKDSVSYIDVTSTALDYQEENYVTSSERDT